MTGFVIVDKSLAVANSTTLLVRLCSPETMSITVRGDNGYVVSVNNETSDVAFNADGSCRYISMPCDNVSGGESYLVSDCVAMQLSDPDFGQRECVGFILTKNLHPVIVTENEAMQLGCEFLILIGAKV
ncbi:MAG: hypothetical protein ACRCWB_11670 [Enterovibrio sp.]